MSWMMHLLVSGLQGRANDAMSSREAKRQVSTSSLVAMTGGPRAGYPNPNSLDPAPATHSTAGPRPETSGDPSSPSPRQVLLRSGSDHGLAGIRSTLSPNRHCIRCFEQYCQELCADRSTSSCWEAFHQHAEIGLRSAFPFVLQRLSVRAPRRSERAGDRIETGRVDDHIEFVFGIAGFYAGGRDPLDRRFLNVDQPDVRRFVGFTLPSLQRHAAGAETMVLRDQLLDDDWILHALTDFPRDEVRDRSPGGPSGCRENF